MFTYTVKQNTALLTVNQQNDQGFNNILYLEFISTNNYVGSVRTWKVHSSNDYY